MINYKFKKRRRSVFNLTESFYQQTSPLLLGKGQNRTSGFLLLHSDFLHTLFPYLQFYIVYRDKYISEYMFRELKTILKTRPIYLTTPEHIIAHIDLCVIAFILLNIIKYLVEIRTAFHYSPEIIQDALSKFSAVTLPRHYLEYQETRKF